MVSKAEYYITIILLSYYYYNSSSAQHSNAIQLKYIAAWCSNGIQGWMDQTSASPSAAVKEGEDQPIVATQAWEPQGNISTICFLKYLEYL